MYEPEKRSILAQRQIIRDEIIEECQEAIAREMYEDEVMATKLENVLENLKSNSKPNGSTHNRNKTKCPRCEGYLYCPICYGDGYIDM